MSQLFASGGQSIGVTASTSVLPMLGGIKWINTCKACWTRLTYVVVQSLGLVQLFATPWTVAHLASLSFTLSQSLLRLMSIQLVHDAIQPSHPLSPPSPHTLSFPASGSFPTSQLFAAGGQSIRASASASVLPMNTQSWFPSGLTSLISLLSKGLSRVFSSTVRKHQFFSTQPSL